MSRVQGIKSRVKVVTKGSKGSEGTCPMSFVTSGDFQLKHILLLPILHPILDRYVHAAVKEYGGNGGGGGIY